MPSRSPYYMHQGGTCPLRVQAFRSTTRASPTFDKPNQPQQDAMESSFKTNLLTFPIYSFFNKKKILHNTHLSSFVIHTYLYFSTSHPVRPGRIHHVFHEIHEIPVENPVLLLQSPDFHPTQLGHVVRSFAAPPPGDASSRSSWEISYSWISIHCREKAWKISQMMIS